MRNWTKRGLAILLAAMMLVTLMPAALAAEQSEEPAEEPAEAVETPAAPDAEQPEEAGGEEPAEEAIEDPVEEPVEEAVAEPVEEEPAEEPDNSVAPASLLPLEEKTITVDLTDRLPMELRAVKVSELLANEIQDAEHPDRPLIGTEKVAWARNYSDAYQVVDMEDTLNLRAMFGEYSGTMTLCMIVGSGKQLDGNSIRYRVTINITPISEWLIPMVYKVDSEGTRTEIPVRYHYYFQHNGNSFDNTDGGLYFSVRAKDFDEEDEHLLVVEYNENLASQAQSLSIAPVYWYNPPEGEKPVLSPTGNGFSLSNFLDFYPNRNYVMTIQLQDGEGNMLDISESFYLTFYLTFPYMGEGGDLRNEERDWIWDYGTPEEKTQEEVTYDWEIYHLYKEYPADGKYIYNCDIYDEDGFPMYIYDENFANVLAVTGFYKTREEAEAAIEANETEDIKNDLFGNGYKADYSDGVVFSVFYDGEVFHRGVKTVNGTVSKPEMFNDPETELPQRPGSSDTYFTVDGATGYRYSDIYVMPYDHDTYYANGYQTVFLLNDEAELETLKPIFWADDVTHIYAGDPATLQTTGTNTQDFSDGPVHYTAAAENGENKGNYFVTFAKKQTGCPSLYVNGTNVPKDKLEDGSIRRELFLNDYFGQGHDIFIANLGDEEMIGLTATLENAQNVKLDEYWTVGGENNDTLAPIDEVDPDFSSRYGGVAEPYNVAKIRLVPDGKGEIKGTLTITYGTDAAGKEANKVVFTLTGQAGNPSITTTEIPGGVKYVPYATMIRDNNMYDWNKVTYSWSGRLPKGVELRPNGEIYGVPQETGDFTFTVTMRNSVSYFPTSSSTFTLTVEENTDANVEAQTDEGYELTTRLPATVTLGSNQTVTSNGELDEFIDLWLDGQKLVEGVDYEKSEGSTIINALSQVFRNAGNGTHTLALEFRKNGDLNQDLKKAAQNFTIGGNGGTQSAGGATSAGGTGGGTTSSATGGTAESAGGTGESTGGTEESAGGTAVGAFTDVPADAYYASAVAWALEKGVTTGTSATTFTPDRDCTRAEIVTFLWRAYGSPMVSSTNVFTDVPADAYYAAAVAWAVENGITTGSTATTFSPDKTCSRAEAMTFLYRAAGSPVAGGGSAFIDLAADAYYADAVDWAAENGITTGTTATTFSPDKTCTRAEIITFVFRNLSG